MIAVHVGFQTHKLSDGLPTSLMLEPAQHLVVSRNIETGSLRIARENELVLPRPHVLIEVIGADFIHEGVGVDEDELDVVPYFFFIRS